LGDSGVPDFLYETDSGIVFQMGALTRSIWEKVDISASHKEQVGSHGSPSRVFGQLA